VTTLFISDLHLDGSRPDISAQFLQFLNTGARQADALYILGDLFEVWIGDDDNDAEKVRVQAALRNFTASGIPCYVMHGNRDFLLGKRFCANTGCTLLPDPSVIELYGRRVLLMHGDSLCTDDRHYQRARRILRNPIIKGIFRRLSLSQRQRHGANIRAKSQAHINNLLSASMTQIMDVNDAAVRQTLTLHGVDLLIHGHTHRPAVHSLTVNNVAATRIVLGDWYTQGSVLYCDAHGFDVGFDLRTLPRAA
jgi:UDP-2,3-diacylglucosamine hydrolase